MIYRKIVKRSLDFFIGVISFALIWWLMLCIGIVILLTDGLPIFFVQERIGQYGKRFKIYKFRTMVKNADELGPKFTSVGDKRITPIGTILRKTSLDELPQIFNLIKGDMSFVGYRPGVFENYVMSDFESGMFNVKPGITGYAQVNGRSALTLAEKRAWEIKYVQDISFLTDIKILIKTVLAVVMKRGSY